mgnify:CR=1 FL=1
MKKQNDNIDWARKWLYAMLGVVVVVYVGLAAKYIYVLVHDTEGWIGYSEENQFYNDTVYGDRGSIYDCQGRLVQATFPYYTVQMDLRVPFLANKEKRLHYTDTITNYEAYADSVCVAVSDYFKQYTHAELRKKMDEAFRKGNGNFKIVEGRINYKQLRALKAMPLFNQSKLHSGLLVTNYENRENLYGNLAYRVVGAVFGDRTNKSGRYARFGLEEYFDKELTGEPGIVEHRAGSYDRPIKRPIDGLDVVMTIDMDIQDKCEALLRNTFSNSSGDKACMMVMEVKTGEIKAMVNLKKDSATGNIIQGENYCISYRAQPGSTIKPLALLAMYDDDACDTTNLFDVGEHGSIVIPGTDKRIYDSHFVKRYLTAKEAVAFSSNCGMVQIALAGYNNRKRSSWQDFHDAMQDIGFTHKIGIELNTEAEPILYNPETYKGWSLTTMPSMAYGYEIMMTPLYTMNFYNALANDGYYVRPHIVRELRRGGEVVRDFSATPNRSRMAGKKSIKFIKECLLDVVENPNGTAYSWVRNSDVRIAGKTGTARMVGLDANGVQRYMVTFVGYFPADNPKYTAIVVMTNNYLSEGAPSRCGSVVRDIAKHLMINY